MSDKTALLLKLQEAAKTGKNTTAETNLQAQQNEQQQADNKLRTEATQIVTDALAEKKLFAIAATGKTHCSVKLLKANISADQLSGLEKFIFEEIRNQGFQPLILSVLEEDDYTDYSIGIQWKNVK